MGWFWWEKRNIKSSPKIEEGVPKRRWNDTPEYRLMELMYECDRLKERLISSRANELPPT